MKPSFAAPAQPLEKSLREQMDRQSPTADGAAKSPSGSERSPSLSAASYGLPTLPLPDPAKIWVDPKALSITDEEKEKRLQVSGLGLCCFSLA